MFFILPALGLLPFAFGSFMNWLVVAYPDTLPPFLLLSIATLLIWTMIAFVAKSKIKRTSNVIIGLNLVGFIVLVLIGIQELWLHTYWMNLVGSLTQCYFLPLLNIGFALTRWSHSVFSAYCAAFLLMVLAAFLGCKLRNVSSFLSANPAPSRQHS